MRWPSWMPAGISTSSVRVSSTRPAPVAGLARVLDDASAAAAVRARPACARSRRRRCARPAAGDRSPSQRVQVDRVRAGLDAVAVARRARHRGLVGDADLDAPSRVDQLDLDLRRDVRASTREFAPRIAAPKHVVAEERREEVAEAADVDVRRREPARAQPADGRSGRRARASRSSRAPRTPRSPRGSAPRRRARRRRRGAARRASRRNAFLIVASSASRGTPSSS